MFGVLAQDQKRTNANVTKVLVAGKVVCRKLIANQVDVTTGGITTTVESFNLNVKTLLNTIQFDPAFAIAIINTTKEYGQIVNHAVEFVTTQNLMPNVLYTVGVINNVNLRPINDSAAVHLAPMNIELSGIVTQSGNFNILVPTGIPLPVGSILKFNFTYAIL